MSVGQWCILAALVVPGFATSVWVWVMYDRTASRLERVGNTFGAFVCGAVVGALVIGFSVVILHPLYMMWVSAA